MREATYYRASAFLPVALPLLLIGGDLLVQRLFGTYVAAGRIGTLLVGSLYIAGIPYSFFGAVSLFLLRHQPSRAYRRAAIGAPVLFLPVLWLFALCVSASSSQLTFREQLAEVPTSFGYLALLVLPLGYAYVAIVLLGAAALSRAGLIERV